MNKKHLMIDLETLGSTPGCPIISIGAVEFFPTTQTLGQEFYASVDLQSCLDAGLKPEGETFYWWLTQSEGARKALLSSEGRPRYTLAETLASFTGYLYEPKDTLIWGHGPSFDLSVLACAFRSLNMERPWSYRNERDTRTVLDLADMKFPNIADGHQALSDAKMQATVIMLAIQKLCGNKYL